MRHEGDQALARSFLFRAVAAHVFAEKTDSFIQGAANDRPTKGIIAVVSALTGSLGADHEPVLFAQENHAAIGLREQTQQVIQQSAEQGIKIERVAEIVGDLQHHL